MTFKWFIVFTEKEERDGKREDFPNYIWLNFKKTMIRNQSWEVSISEKRISFQTDAHFICLSYLQKTTARILSPLSEPQLKTTPLALELFPFWFRGNNLLQV